MSIDFDPYGPLRRKPASAGVDIAAKLGSHRQALTPPVIRSRAATRRRIVSICLVGSAILGLGPIASVAPLTTTAFGDELRDTAAAGVGRAETDEATAPKLRPDGLREGETGIVPSQADTRDQEKGTGNPPVASSSVTCVEALASEPLRNMDQYLKDIGIHYEKIFNQALSEAGCTGQQVADFLIENGAKLDEYREYGEWNAYSFTYRRSIFSILPFDIVITEKEDNIFIKSNWSLGFI